MILYLIYGVNPSEFGSWIGSRMEEESMVSHGGYNYKDNYPESYCIIFSWGIKRQAERSKLEGQSRFSSSFSSQGS